MSWDGWKVENPMVRDELWDNWQDEFDENFDVELDYRGLPDEKREDFFSDVSDFADGVEYALSLENYVKKGYITLFGHVEDYERDIFDEMLENYPEVKVYE